MPDEPTTTLELLITQDEQVRSLLQQCRDNPGRDVETRWERGNKEKLLLDQVALREAAKHYLADGLRHLGRDDLADEMLGDVEARVPLIDELDTLMAGVQATSLGPDVDELVGRLGEFLDPEIDHELDTVVPAILRSVDSEELAKESHDPRYVRKHAPTHPGRGNRWWEGWGPLERAQAIFDHLRSEPGGAARPSNDQGAFERTAQPFQHIAGGAPSGDGQPADDEPGRRD